MDREDPMRKITYFASTHTRGKQTPFGIRAIDRMKHVYVIGKTGMGKSTLLENFAIQDIQNGEGICFIDPHGSTAEKLLEFVPQERVGDVMYLAPFDMDYPIGFNVMEDVGYDKRHLVASGLMSVFKRIWVDAWSARMEYILQNALLALLEYPDSTLLDVNRMLVNKDFRKDVVSKVSDPIVKSFWAEEFANYSDRYTQDATPAIQNKIGQFTANPLIRNIVGQPKSSFDIRKMMDEKKILIINLSKGKIGETNTVLLGSLLTVKIYLGALSRADESPAAMHKLPPFYFYVDEFQSVANDSFANILSEARKYKLALTIANQYIEQMEENVRNAVFGNVGSMITFRVGPMDAEVMKVIFEPTFIAEDLVGLGVGAIYLTLMIDGVGSPPFSAQTLPPIDAPQPSFVQRAIEQSRSRYGRPRAKVEEEVKARSELFKPEPGANNKDKKPAFGDRRPMSGGAGGNGYAPRPATVPYGERPRPPRAEPSGDMRPPRVERDERPPRTEESREPREQAPRSVPVPAEPAPLSTPTPPQAPARAPADILRQLHQKKKEESAPVPPPRPPVPKAAEYRQANPLRDALKAALNTPAPAPATPAAPRPAEKPAQPRDHKSAHALARTHEKNPEGAHAPRSPHGARPAAHHDKPQAENPEPQPRMESQPVSPPAASEPAPELRPFQDSRPPVSPSQARPPEPRKTDKEVSEDIIRRILYGNNEEQH